MMVKIYQNYTIHLQTQLITFRTVEKYQIFKVIETFCNIKCDGNGCAVDDDVYIIM